MQNSGMRIFENIDKSRIDAILKGLIDHGSVVTGINPWDVDTRNHGVRLRGEWVEDASQLVVTITHAAWYVPRETIWENIETLIRLVREAA